MSILSQRYSTLPVYAVLLGIFILFILTHLALRNVIENEQDIYNVEVARLKDTLTQKLTAAKEVLNSIKVVFDASTSVDPDEFFTISQDILARHPYIKYTTYMPLVLQEDRTSFEALVNDKGYPSFNITQKSEGYYVPAEQRIRYLPVLYQEPFEPETVGRLGLDYLSIPAYAIHILHAIDSSKVQTSMPEQILDKGQGFMIFKALYAGKTAPGPTDERRASANGIVAIRVDVPRLLLKEELPADMDVTLSMRSTSSNEYLAPMLELLTSVPAEQQKMPKLHTFETYHNVIVGSKFIKFAVRKDLYLNKRHYQGLIGAILIGLIVTTLMWFLARAIKSRSDDLEQRNQQIQHLVNLRTQELAQEKEKAQITLESIADAVITVDSEGYVDYLNPIAERLIGWPELYIIGRPVAEAVRFVDQFTSIEVENPVVTSMQTGQPLFDCGKLALQTQNGSNIPVDVSAAPLHDKQHTVAGGVLTFRDVSDARKLTQEITHQATHDALTGLPNRVLLKEKLERELHHARENNEMFAVMFLDLDRFKIINDSLGHDVGDALLKMVAQRLFDCLRSDDMVARLGGDEFVIIVREISSTDNIEMIAQKLLPEINRAYLVKQQEIFTSASIGIAIYPDDGVKVAELMRNADVAMYRAKSMGKNNYALYTHDMTSNSQHQFGLETDMRRAIQEEEFRLYYQPQVDLQTGAIIGAEALIRWQHPEHGMLPPSEFLELAEDNGLISPIGHWVLHEACRQNKLWQEEGLIPIKVAVNIADRQFHDLEFANEVLLVLQQYQLEAQFLELELTEGILARHTDDSLLRLDHLKQQGIGFSIDDFGTGYSSLAYLKRFPLNTIKIDRSFVKDITTDRKDAEICSAIIAMARNLHLRVIAEGVEDKAQLRFLKERGCNAIQGYFFSPPVPADEFAVMLRENNLGYSLAEDILKTRHSP